MRVLITGSTSGLGAAMAHSLEAFGIDVIRVDIRASGTTHWCDVSNSNDIQRLYSTLASQGRLPDVIINNAGVNYIDWLRNTAESEWDRVMDVNAKSIYLMARQFMPCLKEVKGTMINITSNAAWMPMTNSICYNASKAAADMATKQLAREHSPDVTIFGIAPNKLEGTGMSMYIENTVCGLRGWSKEEAEAYQLAALPAGAETPPAQVADFVRYLLTNKEHHRYLTGTIIPYGK